jgi:hypothetical protein
MRQACWFVTLGMISYQNSVTITRANLKLVILRKQHAQINTTCRLPACGNSFGLSLIVCHLMTFAQSARKNIRVTVTVIILCNILVRSTTVALRPLFTTSNRTGDGSCVFPSGTAQQQQQQQQHASRSVYTTGDERAQARARGHITSQRRGGAPRPAKRWRWRDRSASGWRG